MSKIEMLTPQNSAIALIDYQPAMYQGVQSHDRLVVFNNVEVLAKAAKLFNIPTVLTTVAKDTFSGEFMPEVASLFPDHKIIDKYGVWGEKLLYGRKYQGLHRTTFLIDGKGVVRGVWHKVRVPGHVAEVLKAARAL